MIGIVDCNNFYASCERVFNPALIGKPVVILSNNDGCVIARSNEAKELGIEMGDPYFQKKDFFSNHDVVCRSSNYALYGDMSERVMNLLASFTPSIEIYSIDEAFLDFSGLIFYDLDNYVSEIRTTTFQYTGIPVSIGVAPTKTLAKVANKVSKKRKSGQLILDTQDKINQALSEFKIGDIWGLGRRYEKRLNSYDIHTALDLIRKPDSWILKEMTIVGLRIVKELRGIPCLDLELVRPRKKGICSSKQFGKQVESLDELKEALADYCTILAAKLRKDRSCCKLISIFVETNYFNEKLPQYSANKNIALPVPTNSTSELIQYAVLGLKAIFRKGYKYKKCGIFAMGIVPEDQVQTNLFDSLDRNKRRTIDQVFDRLNLKHGKGTLKVATEGIKKDWFMKRQMLSQNYTTDWSDIITVKL